VALGFAVAILLLGTPIALIVRVLHDGLLWLVRPRGELSALVEVLMSASSVAGSVVIAAVFTRLLVRFFHWRRTLHARVISEKIPHVTLDREELGKAALREEARRSTPTLRHIELTFE